MIRPDPDVPIVIDSATGEWLPGVPAPGLVAAGRGHAWQMVEGIWRLADPEDDDEAVYRAVRVVPGSSLCLGDGCRRTRELSAGVGYICGDHMSGVDMSTGLAKVADDGGSDPPTKTDPARSRRKEPDMAATKAPTKRTKPFNATAEQRAEREDADGNPVLGALGREPKAKRARKTDSPMTNAGSPEHKAATAKRSAVGADIPREFTAPDPLPTDAETRHCIGAPKFGIAPHEAPVSAFGKHNRGPGGLSRMCRADWKVYAKALAASKAGESVTTVVTESAPAAPRLRPVTPEQAEKATRVRKARATIDAIDALPGPEHVAAIGSDEAQEALGVLADASLGAARTETTEDDD